MLFSISLCVFPRDSFCGVLQQPLHGTAPFKERRVRSLYYLNMVQNTCGGEAPLSGGSPTFSLQPPLPLGANPPGWGRLLPLPRFEAGGCSGAQVRLSGRLSLKKQIAVSFPCLESLSLAPRERFWFVCKVVWLAQSWGAARSHLCLHRPRWGDAGSWSFGISIAGTELPRGV